jgi:hypothetical protein
LLIPGLADRLAADLPDLRAACQRAVAHLAGTGQVVIVSAARPGDPGPVPGDALLTGGLTRSDRPVAPPVRLAAGSGPDGVPGAPVLASVGTVVGAHLLEQAGVTVPTSALQVAPGSGTQLLDSGRTGLLVMADGAACHGEHAPGAEDPRSEGFDRDLVTALRSGDPARLADACRRLSELAPALRADSLPALAALADLTAGNGPARAELLHYAAPFGVGYAVAAWQWD